MRDIRAIQFERRLGGPGVGVPGGASLPTQAPPVPQPQDPSQEPANLLPLQSFLPQYYQQLQQTGKLPQEGIVAVLKDVVSRLDALESQGQGDQSPAAPEGPGADSEAPEGPPEDKAPPKLK